MNQGIFLSIKPKFLRLIETGEKNYEFRKYIPKKFFDRIYVYERDAPGSFNVPAMYGRGWFASAVASAHVTGWLRLYARASYTGYHFMEPEKGKPGKAELKFQMVFRF